MPLLLWVSFVVSAAAFTAPPVGRVHPFPAAATSPTARGSDSSLVLSPLTPRPALLAKAVGGVASLALAGFALARRGDETGQDGPLSGPRRLSAWLRTLASKEPQPSTLDEAYFDGHGEAKVHLPPSPQSMSRLLITCKALKAAVFRVRVNPVAGSG